MSLLLKSTVAVCLLSLGTLFTSCKKEQVSDPGKYYMTRMELTKFGLQNPDGASWDDDGGTPDIYVRYNAASSNSWRETDTKDNVATGSLSWTTDNVELSSDNWKFEVMDDDFLVDESMYRPSDFNPIKDLSPVVVSNAQYELKIYWERR